MEPDFIATFLEEAQDLLAAWEQTVESLSEQVTTELLNDLFRSAHSLKGSGKSVGLEVFGDLVHLAEDVLSQVIAGRSEWNDATYDLFDELGSFLSSWLQELGTDTEFVPETYIEWCQRIEIFSKTKPVESEDTGFGFFEEDSSANTQVLNETSSVEKTADLPGRSASIRVDVDSLDSMSRILGEMVVATEIMRMAKLSETFKNASVEKAIDSLSNLCDDANVAMNSLRLHPVKALLGRLSRVTSDTARKVDKRVRVKTLGDDVELDKLILEKMKDPLVHIVRNAVDHGLETAEERQRTEKNETANITISAARSGLTVIIRVEDDGRGIDPDRILAKAVEKGLVSADESFSPEETLMLITRPGFSTADRVTDISGRGVGMDVVVTAIREMGGELKIRSSFGHGSCFEVHLPTNISILDCLIVESANELFAVPIEEIDEVFLTNEKQVEASGDGVDIISWNGKQVPMCSLAQTLGMGDEGRSELGVLVGGKGRPRAFTFRAVRHQQSIFLRPLEGTVEKRQAYLGSAILPDGLPTLVLDLNHLAKEAA